ncbi:hypothetical protein BHE74_00054694, partial [Ensete ventricosum]
ANHDAERHRPLGGDAEHALLDGGAEAQRGFGVRQALEEGAALATGGRRPDEQADVAEEVEAGAQLEGVPGAEWVGRRRLGRVVRPGCLRHGGLGIAWCGGSGEGAADESKEEHRKLAGVHGFLLPFAGRSVSPRKCKRSSTL